MAAKQIRYNLTLSPEEARQIDQMYARYLLDNEESLTKYQWIKKKILEEIE